MCNVLISLYSSVTASVESGALFGKNVRYENGEYLVYDDVNAALTEIAADTTNHYTCGTVTNSVADRTCAIVRYYYVGPLVIR